MDMVKGILFAVLCVAVVLAAVVTVEPWKYWDVSNLLSKPVPLTTMIAAATLCVAGLLTALLII